MKKIALNSKKYPGLFALVDDEDYERVKDLGWYPLRGDDRLYVVRNPKKSKPNLKRPIQERLHRFILGIKDSNIFIDHKNGDCLDNRKENLRIASRQENGRNRLINKNNKTGFRGVSLHVKTGKYWARINIGSGSKSLGLFFTAKEASEAYENAAKEAFGDFYRPLKDK